MWLMNRCMALGTYFASDNQDNLRFQVFVFHSYFVLLKSTVSLFLRSVPRDRPRCFIVFLCLLWFCMLCLFLILLSAPLMKTTPTIQQPQTVNHELPIVSQGRFEIYASLSRWSIDSDLCWFGSGNQSCSEIVIPGLEDMSLHVNSSYAFHIFAALPQLSNVLNGVV